MTVLGTLVFPALAQAAPEDPFLDCDYDGDLDKRWSNSELRRAIDQIPSDRDEYANCREILKNAITSGSNRPDNPSGNGSGGGGDASGGGSGGGGSINADEQNARANDGGELEAITGDTGNAKPEVNVGGEQLEPGSNGLFDLASASNDVPVPLLLALIAIGLLAVAGGVVALRDRVPGLARIPLISKIPRVSLARFRR
jgi:hypothetical protein